MLNPCQCFIGCQFDISMKRLLIDVLYHCQVVIIHVIVHTDPVSVNDQLKVQWV